MNIFLSIFGIVAVVAAIVLRFLLVGRATQQSKAKKIKRITLFVCIAGLVLAIFGASFTIVPTNNTGVRTTFGQISDTTLSPGFNPKIPFIQTIDLVNNKQQDVLVGETEIWGETTEKTPVYAKDVTVTYRVRAEKSAWLYANVTKSDKDLISESLASSALKSSMVQLGNKEVTVRSKIEPLVKENLQAYVNEKYGEGVIDILKVVIDDMDFEPEYNAAIAAKSIAQQQAEEQAIKNETAIAKAEADKKVAVANAEAKAESKRIAAEAEAEANKLLDESLNDNILKSKFYEKWDGKLPTVMGEGTAIVDVAGSTSSK